jgi:uncharacterized repeat protein (TIGR03803 family)
MQNPLAIHSRQVKCALALAGLVWLAAAICAPSAQAQTYTVMHRFQGATKDGENPEAGLVMDTSGNFYGTAVNGPACSPTPCASSLGMVFELTPAGVETILHRFTGSPKDGAFPFAGLTRNTANNSFGTTSEGGSANMGVVYEITTAGEKVLHSFTGPPADGAFPYSGLTQDAAGNLYGTTSAGGASNSGTVFKIGPTGNATILYSFTGGADGGFPYGGLVRNSAGNLYGTTSAGGVTTGNCFPYGCGVIFMVTPAGHQTVLYRFTGNPDGAYPYAALIPDTAGNLYGTTYSGGTGACTNGCGTVFELNKAGAETVLYSFKGSPTDGAFPYAGVIRDSAGNLYGTTSYGGPFDSGIVPENGVVFELEAAGTEKVLYSFTGAMDGGVPRAGLVLDSSGNLYGTAYSGGFSGVACGGSQTDTCGVVFKIKP